jgi:hypothetical protein
MSSKDKQKHLVGQPIMKQVVDFIPRDKFDEIVKHLESDRYYKTYDSWTQLITMLFGVFSRCDSMSELCDGMRVLGGKLNYFGLDEAPPKSTAGDGLRLRDNEFFRVVYFMLLKHFEPLLSVSRIDNVSFSRLFIFDSSTIRLFSDVLKGVGRNPKHLGKKKGGLKVHMMIDAHSDTPAFVKISEAKQHDKNFLQYLQVPAHSMIVFDRAYNHYLQFAQWTQQEINFVCRLKSNAVYEVTQTVFSADIQTDKAAGVLKEEHIAIKYKDKKEEKTLLLRKVTYRDEKRRIYEFISNNFQVSHDEIAMIYKLRWNIELLFKKLKQNFQLHYFYSDTENGIKTQIWCTLIAQLLLQVLKVKSESKKAFSTIAALVRMHLISHLDIFWVVQNGRRSYVKKQKQKRNKSPGTQMSLF